MNCRCSNCKNLPPGSQDTPPPSSTGVSSAVSVSTAKQQQQEIMVSYNNKINHLSVARSVSTSGEDSTISSGNGGSGDGAISRVTSTDSSTAAEDRPQKQESSSTSLSSPPPQTPTANTMTPSSSSVLSFKKKTKDLKGDDASQDRLAIMAAVAMTELLSGKMESPRRVSTSNGKVVEDEKEDGCPDVNNISVDYDDDDDEKEIEKQLIIMNNKNSNKKSSGNLPPKKRKAENISLPSSSLLSSVTAISPENIIPLDDDVKETMKKKHDQNNKRSRANSTELFSPVRKLESRDPSPISHSKIVSDAKNNNKNKEKEKEKEQEHEQEDRSSSKQQQQQQPPAVSMSHCSLLSPSYSKNNNYVLPPPTPTNNFNNSSSYQYPSSSSSSAHRPTKIYSHYYLNQQEQQHQQQQQQYHQHGSPPPSMPPAGYGGPTTYYNHPYPTPSPPNRCYPNYPPQHHHVHATTTAIRATHMQAYKDIIKVSGLPKSLSFRKICSKCGRTRGEHGELGFGNKCTFKDCGKCGACYDLHQKAIPKTQMGILCRLTVSEGAVPGQAVTYERKIRALATRAELQKTINEDKRERTERLAQQQQQQQHMVVTTTMKAATTTASSTTTTAV
jgi:hypothetical protein